jgi:sucrose-phosphate synthase
VTSHGTYLDVLPVRASKGKAIRYLSYRWDVPLASFLVAGDSGNDECMLRGDTLGVVVGNYSPELEPLRGRSSVYFAAGAHAAGVLEGIEAYGFAFTRTAAASAGASAYRAGALEAAV